MVENIPHQQKDRLNMEPERIPLPPADVLRLIARENPQVFNRLARASTRIRNILYQKDVIRSLCFAPISLDEVIRYFVRAYTPTPYGMSSLGFRLFHQTNL